MEDLWKLLAKVSQCQDSVDARSTNARTAARGWHGNDNFNTRNDEVGNMYVKLWRTIGVSPVMLKARATQTAKTKDVK